MVKSGDRVLGNLGRVRQLLGRDLRLEVGRFPDVPPAANHFTTDSGEVGDVGSLCHVLESWV